MLLGLNADMIECAFWTMFGVSIVVMNGTEQGLVVHCCHASFKFAQMVTEDGDRCLHQDGHVASLHVTSLHVASLHVPLWGWVWK